MKKINLMLAMGILSISVFLTAQEGSTDTAEINTSTGVPVYEYKPKVLIEGKWGAGPGEFGVAWTYAHDINSPESPSGAKSMPIYPGSLAVNSKGDVYILDTINNRIQKFNNGGKFLKAIEVESYAGEEQPIWYGKVKYDNGIEMLGRVTNKDKQGNTIGVDRWFPFYWPITAQGINIVIDSKDTLYYYLKRTKDGKEIGEVWEIKDDKVAKKMKQGEEKPEKELRSFNIKTLANNSKEVEFTTSKKSFKWNFTTSLKMNKASRFLVIEPRIKGKHIFIPSGVSTGKYIKKGEIFESERLDEKIYIFNQEGNIEGIINGGIPGLFDEYGNAYSMETTDKGVVVTKFASGVEK